MFTASIYGVWFYDKDECTRLGQLMNGSVLPLFYAETIIVVGGNYSQGNIFVIISIEWCM